MFVEEWSTLAVIVSALVYIPLIFIVSAIPVFICKLLRKCGKSINEDFEGVFFAVVGVIVFLISSVSIFRHGTFSIFWENAFAVAISTVAARVIYLKISGRNK